jgi:hypothetical protein
MLIYLPFGNLTQPLLGGEGQEKRQGRSRKKFIWLRYKILVIENISFGCRPFNSFY